MIFETIPLAEAEASILAHTLRLPGLDFLKGRKLSQADLVKLEIAGIDRITVAKLELLDVLEDEAANRAAMRLVGFGLSAHTAHTGRVNICATISGLVVLDPQGVNALNLIDEAITIATVGLHEPVEPGQIIATIKVNPYAVSEAVVSAWEAATTVIKIRPFKSCRVSFIQTMSSRIKVTVLQKALLATKARVESMGSHLSEAVYAPHEVGALSLSLQKRIIAGDDLILVCGASSITDRKDVVPSAIVAAGGRVERFGMPVEPGNLLLLGSIGDVPVIGMPGCARSQQLNGFDYVLRLALAGLTVDSKAIGLMGVGGLLRDTPWRATPRIAKADTKKLADIKNFDFPRVAAIILAAGRSSRMGSNKLTLLLEGKPVLRHIVDTVRLSKAHSITVVLGHEAEQVQALLGNDGISFVFNDQYRRGLSTSLKTGISALPSDVDGAMIFLGDMPDISVELVDRMIADFELAKTRSIIVPKRDGRRGHPVLWGRDFFASLLEKAEGDVGGRYLIEEYSDSVRDIEVNYDDIFTDIDTPEEFHVRSQRILIGS